jgi:hypothetical protein
VYKMSFFLEDVIQEDNTISPPGVGHELCELLHLGR